MKKVIFFIFGLAIISGNIFAKENLAVLPFTGGQGDEGETIAELFSFDDRLNEIFNPIPRTSINQAIRREQNFQTGSGMTDADTIVAIGNQLGARYVVAGNISSVGINNLLVISIIDIRNLQQIAGDYQIYTNMMDIRRNLPNMAGNIIHATQRNTASLQKLAIVPVQLQGGVDQRIADTLTQILSIHLIRSGRYTVYPRTRSLEQVMDEHDTQYSGITADENRIGVGFGENPHLVLSVVARRLENVNMFNAAIINLFSGAQIVGRSVDYNDINDGMRAMETLSVFLTSSADEITQLRQDEERRQHEEQRRRERAERRNARRERREELVSNATRNYWVYVSGYMQWGEGLLGGGGSLFTDINFSPLKFTSLGIGSRFGYFNDGFYGTGVISAGLVFPFSKTSKIFADGVLEIGGFGGLDGMLTDWATPGFAFGYTFFERYNGIELKYRGTFFDGLYTHSVSFGWIIAGW